MQDPLLTTDTFENVPLATGSVKMTESADMTAS